MSTDTKIPMTKWSHPDWTGSLVAKQDYTREDVIRDYIGDDEEVDPALLTSEPIEMTQAEIDALPEFEGF